MSTVTSASPTNAAAQNQPHRRGCLFYVKRGLLALVGLLAVLLILGFSYETIMAAGDAQRYPAPGQLVMVDGYSMHIRCLGEGSPTVILESGAGGFSMMWPETIVTQLSQTTRVCAYDRAGYGWSDPRLEPRTAWQIASELHHLLENAQIEAPYILVGASNGGLYVRSYTADYPQEVAGLVLVDGTSEAELDKTKGLPGGIFAVMGRLGIFRLFPDMICPGSACDETAKPMIAAFRGRASLYQTVDNEWAALQASDALAILRERLSPPASLSDTPLVILRANQSGVPESDMDTRYRSYIASDRETMTALSSNHRYILVSGGHAIANEHPGLLIESVNAVVEATHTGDVLAK